MTLTLPQLAQKHNLEPESAKAFLREWIEQQDAYIVQKRKFQNVCSIYSNNLRKGDLLIARPTDLGE